MTFHIPNMTCGSCVKHITQAVTAVDPTAKVDADTATHRVVVTTVADQRAIEQALEAEGYPAQAV